MENSSISWSEKGLGRAEKFLSKSKTLPSSFYERHTLEVAPDLLGKLLLVRSRPKKPLDSPEAGVTIARIVETEAYRANDPASHSARGRTPRASTLFEGPGIAYVYFIYGMYEMLNFVTEPDGQAGAVLIRAVEPIWGEELMKRRRDVKSRRLLTSGPGRLCRAMGIQMSHNRKSLMGPELYVLDDGFRPDQIAMSSRVGISLATDKEWRFFIPGNPFVSQVPQNANYRRCPG